MATLEKVIGLQGQGMSDAQITTQLQNEGVSPTEINDSLNQAKVKSAVSPPEGQAPALPGGQTAGMGEMQASMMPEQGGQPAAPVGQPAAMPPAQPAQAQPQSPPPEVYPPQGQPGAEAYPPQEYAPEQPQDDYYTQTPQAYGQDYYAPQGGTDTETISEIAEQVATEKLNEFKAKTGDLVSFKNNIQDKVNDIDDRLKRIEGSIDKLQQAIIGKIGEFGESNAMVHKDLENLHGTVSNLMNPLVDNLNELKKLSE